MSRNDGHRWPPHAAAEHGRWMDLPVQKEGREAHAVWSDKLKTWQVTQSGDPQVRHGGSCLFRGAKLSMKLDAVGY